MIKTYDEALKTLNDIRTYLAISRADDCVEELDKVAKYFINEKHKENPTLSDCIKEWEEKGWEVEKTRGYIEFKCFSNYNPDNYCHIFINIESKIFFAEWKEKNLTKPLAMNIKLLNLIHKTIKALEVKDEKEIKIKSTRCRNNYNI